MRSFDYRSPSHQEVEMTDVAVLAPRGDAVAAEAGNTMVRTDGRNRRAAENAPQDHRGGQGHDHGDQRGPTVVGVAKRADVSVRSVFQHFHDVESLFVTVMDSIRADLVLPELPSASRPLAARIEDVVKAFAGLFDKVVPLRVAAGQFVDHPALIERSQQARKELREGYFRGVRARVRDLERAGARAAGRCDRRGTVARRLDRAASPRRPQPRAAHSPSGA
jgi:AcrR family transcriptional regulator